MTTVNTEDEKQAKVQVRIFDFNLEHTCRKEQKTNSYVI